MADDVFGIVGTTQAGNFHVERVVAEGGFGVVYRAQHGGFRAPVALKCLKVPEGMSARQRDLFLEKFREEAVLMFQLSASIPEVVRPLHIDVLRLDDGRFVPFLALEWLEGHSLDELIVQKADRGDVPFKLEELVVMLRPIANALSRAHKFPSEKGVMSIIHRDLKPENIFITQLPGGGPSGVKVLDFGIATAKRAATLAVGPVQGGGRVEMNAFTPAYGAPEQWVPSRFGEAGPWTDVWGLALTMVEAMFGGPVIDGDQATMRNIALDPDNRPTPRRYGVPLSEALDRIFLRALAVDPRHRYHDVDSFWRELEVTLAPPKAPSLPPPATPRGGSGLYAAVGGGAAAPRLAEDPSPASGIVRASPTPSGTFSRRTPPALADTPPPPLLAELDVQPGPTSARWRTASSAGLPAVRPGVDAAPISSREPFAPPPSGRGVPPILTSAAQDARMASSQPPPSSMVDSEAKPSALRQLRPTIGLIVAALLISVVDQVYFRVTGNLFAIGPVRPVWIAGALGVLAILLFLWRIVDRDPSDG